MRNQMWIIILLLVWIGQGAERSVEKIPELVEPKGVVQSWAEGLKSENRVTISDRKRGERSEVWHQGEDLRGLVRYQARYQPPWVHTTASSGGKASSRSQKQGKEKKKRGGKKKK
mgnify:CR=1 FL=1